MKDRIIYATRLRLRSLVKSALFKDEATDSVAEADESTAPLPSDTQPTTTTNAPAAPSSIPLSPLPPHPFEQAGPSTRCHVVLPHFLPPPPSNAPSPAIYSSSSSPTSVSAPGSSSPKDSMPRHAPGKTETATPSPVIPRKRARVSVEELDYGQAHDQAHNPSSSQASTSTSAPPPVLHDSPPRRIRHRPSQAARLHPPETSSPPPTAPPTSRQDSQFALAMADQILALGPKPPAPPNHSKRRLAYYPKQRVDARNASKKASYVDMKKSEGFTATSAHPGFQGDRTKKGFTAKKPHPAAANAANIRVPARGPPGRYSLAAQILSSERYRLVFRAWGNKSTATIKTIMEDAAEKVRKATPPEHSPSSNYQQRRGNFQTRTFGIHQSFTSYPRYNAFYQTYTQAGDELAKDLEPLIQLVTSLFAQHFPDHYEEYTKCMDFITQETGLKSLWGVFACIAVNTGHVVALPHADIQNFAGGLCVIIAFGDFDYETSAFLILELDGEKYEVELPAGIPIFIPSALVVHGNAEIRDGERRGSIVFWTSGALMRWYQLEGNSVGSLSEVKKAEWEARLPDRLRDIVKLFPVVP